nr:hypothetical protein [Tanacetum cinerariifolium]
VKSDDLRNALSVLYLTSAHIRRKGVVIRDPKKELSSDTPAETPKVKDKGKGILIKAPKPMKKKDQIEMDAEYARKLQEEINKEHEESFKNIDWNAALDHILSKEPQYIKRYHGMKKKPQTESEARKNIILYLKNTEGYKMDFCKGMKEEIEAEDEDIIKSINETPAQKAAKRRKLHEQAKEDEDLKKKVPVVDYGIVMINNKPSYKIIKTDVEKRYPLSKFTLEQLVNVVRLKVEEESKMSLELLRFTRQQLQEYQQG